MIKCDGCGGPTREVSHGAWCDACGGVVRPDGFYVRLVASFKDAGTPPYVGLGPAGEIQILKDTSLGDYTVSWWVNTKTQVEGREGWTEAVALRTRTYSSLRLLIDDVSGPGHHLDTPSMLKVVPGPSITGDESVALRI